jgi:cytochrome c oxidase assembly factor CtaG
MRDALGVIVGLIGFLIFLAALVFWIRMLIDCAKNEAEGTEKIVWIIVIIFTGIIGALIYHFVRRPQRWALLHR